MEVWSEDDDAGAEELDKLIYQAEGDENRRRRIACAVAVMCQLVVKMTTSALHSYQEQASSIAPLILHLQSLQATIVKAKNIKRRRIEKEWWVKPRSLVWSDRFVTGAMDRETFKKLFNMSACTFEWLCCQLAPLVLKTDTNFRSSIPPRKRIAIGIHRLACGSSFLEVSKMFAVGEATVLTCTRELYGALVAAFGHVLAFPRGDSLNKVIEGFRVITGLPNCCGVIGSSRFKIKRPTGPCGTDYLDDEKSFSVGAQIVVDSSMRILNIAVGFPGSVQGSKILKVSGLFEKVKNGMLLDGPAVLARSINRVRSHVKIPQYLIGDLKYPLLPWMMVPYNDLHHHSHHNLLHQQQQQQQHQQQQLGLWKMKLNRKMSECSFLVEHVLMGLRKWGVLEKSMNVDVQTGVELVVSCAILHNVLVEKNEYGDLMMMQQQQQQQQQFQQQQQQQQFQQQQQEMMLMMMMMMERTEFPNENGYDGNADDIRDALASHVLLSA